MALPLVRAERNPLLVRVASALVLAPLPLLAIWLGSPAWQTLIAAAGGIMAWEWARLTRDGEFGASGWALLVAIVTAILIAAYAPAVGLLVAVVGVIVVFFVSWLDGDKSAHWVAFGTLWIGIPSIALVWLGLDPTWGRATVLWILFLVWSVDTGAYAVGRLVGGPRLAPRISPMKTWAGLAGGLVAGAAVGGVTGALIGSAAPLRLILLSCVLVLVEQAGDLAESFAKRRFGVKDASGLIPGHGGLWDRVDGLLTVVAAIALLTVILRRSPLAWS